MIALVAAWSSVAGAVAHAQVAVVSNQQRSAGARIAALIRKDARNTQTVTFADKRLKPVRVMRGAPVAAALSIRLPGPPARRPIRVEVQVVSFANPLLHPVTVLRGTPVARVDLFAAATHPGGFELLAVGGAADLDRVAFAVDGAESSHGADPAMWRPELDGPQGPMQVSAAAAIDSGGGDRFNVGENRLLGRVYLARLYGRYGNWADAVAAYNWGPANLDGWIAQGRPAGGLPIEVAHYRDRVLLDSGLWSGPGVAPSHIGWRLAAP
jgi:hypothetical protein